MRYSTKLSYICYAVYYPHVYILTSATPALKHRSPNIDRIFTLANERLMSNVNYC